MEVTTVPICDYHRDIRAKAGTIMQMQEINADLEDPREPSRRSHLRAKQEFSNTKCVLPMSYISSYRASDSRKRIEL